MGSAVVVPVDQPAYPVLFLNAEVLPGASLQSGAPGYFCWLIKPWKKADVSTMNPSFKHR